MRDLNFPTRPKPSISHVPELASPDIVIILWRNKFTIFNLVRELEIRKRKGRFKRLKIERTSRFIGGKIIISSYFSQSYSFSPPRSKPIRQCSADFFPIPPDLDLRAAADLVLVLVLVLTSHSETESDLSHYHCPI